MTPGHRLAYIELWGILERMQGGIGGIDNSALKGIFWHLDKAASGLFELGRRQARGT